MPYFSPGILGPQVALDFSRLTEDAQDVSLDLSSDGEILGGYQNMTILTESGEQRRFIDVLVGGPGNDLLIGNDGNNLLLGRDGSDTLVGNGGNDQLNANRDFSPDVDNAPNGVDDRYDLDDDLTLFGAQVITFSNQTGISATSKKIFELFGMFGYGEGTTDFEASFNTANGLAPAPSADLLNGSSGDDALFGFNNAIVTVLGGPGNDIYSTNVDGGTSLVNMEEGQDTILFATGDTIMGGLGDDLISEARFNPEMENAITFLFGGGNDDTINAGQGPDEIRPGNGQNLINLIGSMDTLIGEGGDDDINSNSGFQISW